MTTSTTRAAALCALLATTSLASPALAQTASPPPVRQSVDANGVDLLRGTFNFARTELAVGPEAEGLVYTRLWSGNGWLDNYSGTLSAGGGFTTVSVGGWSDRFTLSNGVYTNTEGGAARLTRSSNGGTYTYTAADGTVITFSSTGSTVGTIGNISEIRRPSGEVLTYSYQGTIHCPDPDVENCQPSESSRRLRSIANNHGYQIVFGYESNTITSSWELEAWHRISYVTGLNNVVEYCSPAWASCGSMPGAPTVRYVRGTSGSNSTFTVIDNLNRQWRATLDLYGRIIGLKRPGSANDNVTIGYDIHNRVTSVSGDNGHWSYAYLIDGNVRTVTVTDPLNRQQVLRFDIAKERPLSQADALGRTTSFEHDAAGRLTRITAPETNAVAYGYDARGNVTSTTAIPKPGSGLANIVASASFAASCVNPVICNKPLSTTDARGFVTDYSYDPTHGGLTSVTQPAQPNGVRPQTRYAYALREARYKDYTGAIVPSGKPLYRLAAVSACQTQDSCAGTADEVKTVIDYGPADVANNLLPVATSSGAGDNSLLATSSMTYDSIGNLVAVDGPLPGSDDTVRYRYDTARQLVGTASPDPDGAGALKHRAVRSSYNADGQVTKAERGTVTDPSDAAWAAFSPIEAVETGYDANARPVTTKLVASGATHALTQIKYDPAGQVECTAVRMNPSAFGSLPDACTSTGPNPDRITRTVYDAAGQVTQVRTAVGTAVEAAEVSTTYRPNGQVETLTDGENNLTAFYYDGHDRYSRTHFPVPQKGAATASPTDYEEVGYDAASNVAWRRLRGNSIIYFGYDALNRLAWADNPLSGSSVTDQDIWYAYDNLGRLKDATDGNGHYARFTHDALGRTTSEASLNGGVKTMQYDLAGRRTRLTHHDGFFVTYEHLTTGETSAIRENGSFALVSFGYDDLGRRTTLTRGNGTTTSYGYDPASRLQTLVQDFPNPGSDLTLTMGYNPASQIVTRSGTHGLYAFQAHANGTVGSTVNGLNQLVTNAGAAISHDARGNLTHDGVTSFQYNLKNQLAGKNGTTQLYYEPLGRLTQQWNGGGTLDWTGSELIAEFTAQGGYRRYVHGPGVDEPLVWYEGAGTSDRRYLHADERGSIVAISDGGGNAIGYNAYDDYGLPQYGTANTLLGRFGYTGQAWLPEIQRYYYKNRMYWADGGRFMQTDPIGYGAGMNLYAYVRNDPVNLVDPWGLQQEDPQKPEEDEGVVVTAQGCLHPGAGCRNLVPSEYAMAEDLLNRNSVRPFGRMSGWSRRPKPQRTTKQSRRKPDCISLNEPIAYLSFNFDMALGVGGGIDVVRFRGLRSGLKGTVAVGSFLAGWGGSAGVSVGRYRTLGDLLGAGARISSQVPGAGFASGEAAFNRRGLPVGGGAGVGAGGGAFAGITSSKLLSSEAPVCQ